MNKSFYFQHDYNSANDHKILFLRQQFGIEGFGIYWYIIEQLAQNNGKLPLKLIPVIAMQIQTTPDKVSAVIKNYELFDIDESNNFFSIRLLKQIEFRSSLSDFGKRGALNRWGKKAEIDALNSPPISPPNAKGKERKGKEIKDMDITYDLNSNPNGLFIIIKETANMPIKIHQQSFEKWLDGTFGAAYEGQKITLKKKPPIEQFFKNKNGEIFNNNGHVWASFKKLWISVEVKQSSPRSKF